MLTILATVAEHAAEEGSPTGFYIAAGALAAWGVLIGAVGVLRPAFPRGDGGARAVMLVSAVLMVAAMATAALGS
jgi:hypothetical protein